MRDLLKVFFYYYDINTGVDFLFKCFSFFISIRFTLLISTYPFCKFVHVCVRIRRGREWSYCTCTYLCLRFFYFFSHPLHLLKKKVENFLFCAVIRVFFYNTFSFLIKNRNQSDQEYLESIAL